ncbi:MAG: transcription elongation factor GreB [Labilithrix sp.]|nr:transcription elongation factor GreB [Labilithrix sp.]MCW5816904.1 transcription elongation factor GreB [Labilithrix sp.]
MSDNPNYITRAGARRLQEELVDLRTKQRPKVVQDVADAAAQGDRSENAEYIYGKKKLREIDRRIHFLTKRLESARVVEPTDRPVSPDGATRVYFGATVTIEDEDGNESTYTIVGQDEIDAKVGRISHRSPLALALMKRREGDTFTFRKPAGEVDLTVTAIRYESDH